MMDGLPVYASAMMLPTRAMTRRVQKNCEAVSNGCEWVGRRSGIPGGLEGRDQPPWKPWCLLFSFFFLSHKLATDDCGIGYRLVEVGADEGARSLYAFLNVVEVQAQVEVVD
jgi:hypothetical protein